MESRSVRSRMAEFALVGIASVWGVTFVVVQQAISQLPVMTFLAYRFLIAAAVVALVFRTRVRSLPRQGWQAGGWMAVFLTGGYVTQTLGLQYTTAANAGFITGMFVVLTPLLGAVVLRQQIPTVVWIAIGVSAMGLYLLSGAGTRFQLRGDSLELLCAASFACHFLATGRAATRYDTGALLTVQLGACGLFCLVVSVLMGSMRMPHGGTVWGALLVTSLLASALGFFVQTYAQRYTFPARTALILASEPVFAGVSSYVLQGQRLSAEGWVGAALILLAIVAVEWTPRVPVKLGSA